jgi:putative phosphoesterase
MVGNYGLAAMKRILLLSDNHGYWDAAILHHASQADEVWHAGDWLNSDLLHELEKLQKPVRAVYGNADGQELRRIFPEHLHFELEGLRIYMTHIGGYTGKYREAVKEIIAERRPNVFICGHSHILRVDRDPSVNNMICLNPGACGLQGFHKIRTALRFSLENGKLQALEAIEFGRRN